MEKDLIFDIETGPLAADVLAASIPPFDPMGVKLGNVKDADKIRAKVEEAREEYQRESVERAALSPVTGQVLAIGYYAGGGAVTIIPAAGNVDEREMLEHFWSLALGDSGRINRLIGFNSNGFDLPFLVKRSWALGVRVPFGLRRGRYWNENCVDLRETWLLGEYHGSGSLDAVARFLGVGKKTEGVKGGDFAVLWANDRAKAVEYLTNDVLLTRGVAERLGVVAMEGDY